MAVAHVLNTRTNLVNQVLTDLGANAQMVLRDVSDLEVALLTLGSPSGTVSGAVLSLTPFADETNANGGVCTYLTMETSGGTEIFRFNASGDGVTLSSTTIGATDTVQSGTITYTAPA